MKEKLIRKIYNYYASNGHSTNGLYSKIEDLVMNKGENGANQLLDWCRDEFENTDENADNYKELENIWDLCNWYLDYLQENYIDEKWLLERLED